MRDAPASDQTVAACYRQRAACAPAGCRCGPIVALVDELQRDDPVYQREFEKLYGLGLRALATGELVSAGPTDDFGPED
jgi:hypothetical protein